MNIWIVRKVRSRILHSYDGTGRTDCGRNVGQDWLHTQDTPETGMFRLCVRCSQALSRQEEQV